jgi:hypothetical protein
MLRSTSTAKPRRTREFYLGLVCIVLLLLAGLAQVAHSHAGGWVPHQDCALCVTAHVSFTAPVPITLPAVSENSALVELSAFSPTPRSFFTSSPYIRPPPVAPASL